RETSFGTECTQHWHDLIETSGNERYCTSCEKHIIDFTKWSEQEMLEYFKSHSQPCGMFRIDQVDPSVVEIKVSFPNKLFKSIFALATLLWSYEAKSQGENKSHTVIEYKFSDCDEDSVPAGHNQNVMQSSQHTEKTETMQKA